MTTTLKHAKIKTTIHQPDGTDLIHTDSYYEKLNSVKQEIQQSIKTSKASFMADLMRCVSPISDGTSKEVTILIEANDNNEPIRIVQTRTILKEHYGR